LEERHNMTNLKWKKNSFNPRALRAEVPRELGGGVYSIGDDGPPHGFTAYFNEQVIGEAETREEAIALAQAHNDDKLIERIQEQHLAAAE
jgi:hypothetical protein